jgi:tetratricopeptide (TPR) repeat protein
MPIAKGERIRELRTETAEKLSDLIRLAGIAERTWRRAEEGLSVSSRVAQCIANAFTKSLHRTIPRSEIAVTGDEPHELQRALDWSGELGRTFRHLGERYRNDNGFQRGFGNLVDRLLELDCTDPAQSLTILHAAIPCACLSGNYKEAFRLLQERIIPSWRRHGATQTTLSTLSWFFLEQWNRPRAEFELDQQAFLLYQAGVYLRTLGYLIEAVLPFEEASRLHEGSLNDSIESARDLGNLADIYLTLGDMSKAEHFARKAIEAADKGANSALGDTEGRWQRVRRRATLANVLHHRGQFEISYKLFDEAEKYLCMNQNTLGVSCHFNGCQAMLYSVQGFRYCDLLLTLAEAISEDWLKLSDISWYSHGRSVKDVLDDVRKRVELTFSISQHAKWHFDLALDELTLGRLELMEHVYCGKPDTGSAESHLNEAVAGLEQAETMDLLPKALIVRSVLKRETRRHDEAENDLNEAERLSAKMPLYKPLIEKELSLLRAARALDASPGLAWRSS